ncbi:MAG TPA: polyphenol oxidase family protein, partial [Polyangia bacterium]|nr:polyphenol oxidase family protein [Polyangia bacterium]
MHDTEIEHEDEGAQTHLPVIQSRLLGARFSHGFTTRLGGVSGPPFDTLNLGGRWGDAPAAVTENLRRLRGAGTGGAEIHFATQVHGADVAQVEAWQSPRATGGRRADGLVTTEPGVAIGVLAADCVPILVGDVGTGACAAVHAGWRGTVSGALQVTLQRLLELPGASLANLRVAIGPSIGPCCFEVGPEVIAQVEGAFGDAHREGAIVRHPRRPKAHV